MAEINRKPGNNSVSFREVINRHETVYDGSTPVDHTQEELRREEEQKS